MPKLKYNRPERRSGKDRRVTYYPPTKDGRFFVVEGHPERELFSHKGVMRTNARSGKDRRKKT